MILRKPYAFLIKYFKIIHILLFVLCTYLLFKLKSIYEFFQGYVKTDVYTYVENLAGKYIGPFMFVIVFIILISSLAIFYLMREKEKPVLFYRIFNVYGIVLLFSLIIYTNFYNSLEFETYDKLTLSIYRDIIGFVYYSMYFFIIFTFVRGFGFDIKKFSFEKDLKMLNITETDNEEFELSVAIDKEKIMNVIRRENRLFKYYLKENIIAYTLIGGILLIVIGVIFYRNVFVKTIIYKQGEIISTNNFDYQINNTYITTRDKNNQDLGGTFVIVDFIVMNKKLETVELNLSNMRLLVNQNYYYPIVSKYNSFDDINLGYKNQKLSSGVTYSYLLTYRLSGEEKTDKDFILEIYNNETYKNDEYQINYKKIKLNKEYFKDKEVGTFKLNDSLDLSGTILTKGSLKFTDYTISNKFIYEYEECVEENCKTYKKVVISDNNRQVLKLEFESNDLDIEKIKNYLSLNYIYNNKKTVLSEKDINILYSDDKTIFVEIPHNFEKASDAKLKINIRGNIYYFDLSEENKEAEDVNKEK